MQRGAAGRGPSKWDAKKAVDLVVRSGLREVHRYPMLVLRLSLRSYAWDRIFVASGFVSPPALAARRGIGAGSPWATRQLQPYFCTAMRVLMERHPRVSFSLHAGDLGIRWRRGPRRRR